ncbi:MAG: hypothetical protein R2912_07200 [Eubacteriales bacterium]
MLRITRRYNVWAYSLIYNFFSIGVDTLLCVAVAAMPPVQKLFKRVFSKGGKEVLN